MQDFLKPDRIVVGSTDQAAAIKVSSLYLGVAAPVIVTDPASAETIKYAANAFLATKLSFVNAVAAICEGVGADVNDVVLGLGYDKRIGQDFLRPGPGWGGSCFPKDSRALLKIATDAGYSFDLLEGVIAVNDEQFERVTEKIVDAAGGDVAGTDDRRVGPDVQGPHRRPARVAVGGDHRAAARPRAPRCGPTTRPSPGRSPACPTASWSAPTRTRRPRAPTCSSCSPSGTTTAGSTPARSPSAMPGRPVVDARNLLDRGEWRRAGFDVPGHRQVAVARVVVTGGAGFLGSHLCRALLDRGDQVVAVDNLVTGSVSNIEELFGHRGFTFVEHDVSQYVLGPRRGRRDHALRQPGLADRLRADPDPDPQGRRPRHPQLPRPGQGQGRQVLPGLDERGLRRPAGAPAARDVLGQRQPDRPARRLRRGQAVRRGDHDGVPPPPPASTSASCGSSTRTAR